MDELTLKRAMSKGDLAEKAIDTYTEIWKDIEADLWDMWKNSKSDDKEGREDLYREHHAIKAAQSRLKRVVDAGKKAEEELRHLHVNQDST